MDVRGQGGAAKQQDRRWAQVHYLLAAEGDISHILLSRMDAFFWLPLWISFQFYHLTEAEMWHIRSFSVDVYDEMLLLIPYS